MNESEVFDFAMRRAYAQESGGAGFLSFSLCAEALFLLQTRGNSFEIGLQKVLQIYLCFERAAIEPCAALITAVFMLRQTDSIQLYIALDLKSRNAALPLHFQLYFYQSLFARRRDEMQETANHNAC